MKFYRKKHSFVDIQTNDKNLRAKRLIIEDNYQWNLTNAVTKNAGTFQCNKNILLRLVNFWMLPLLNAPYLLAYDNCISFK